MTTPTDWFFQSAETEAAWTQAELGQDGWQLYQQLMGGAVPTLPAVSSGAASAVQPASGAAAPPRATEAAPGSARQPGAPLPPITNEAGSAAPPGAMGAPPATNDPAPAPPDDAPGSAVHRDAAAPPAVVWPAMAYLAGELVGVFVTDMLALTPPGLTKKRVNDWVREHGCLHNEGVVRKGLLNWLRQAGVLDNPNAGLAPHFTETDRATIAQRLFNLPYHTDMERDQ